MVPKEQCSRPKKTYLGKVAREGCREELAQVDAEVGGAGPEGALHCDLGVQRRVREQRNVDAPDLLQGWVASSSLETVHDVVSTDMTKDGLIKRQMSTTLKHLLVDGRQPNCQCL